MKKFQRVWKVFVSANRTRTILNISGVIQSISADGTEALVRWDNDEVGWVKMTMLSEQSKEDHHGMDGNTELSNDR